MIKAKRSKFDHAWILAIFFSAVALFVFAPLSALAGNAVPGTAPVTVTNTTENPVPVTGVVTGTVSGSVEIKNTPSVNINNTPTVTIGNTEVPVTGTVNIGSMPSLTPVRFPLERLRNFVVPDGKTLTIEQVSGSCTSNELDQVPSFGLRWIPNSDGIEAEQVIPITSFVYDASKNLIYYNQTMNAKFLAGEIIKFHLPLYSGVESCSLMWVSGYLQ